MVSTYVLDKLKELASYGFVGGCGTPKPGYMCVEEAISFAMGYEHSDTPDCVASVDGVVARAINDLDWSTNQARAQHLLPIAIASIGTSELPNRIQWLEQVVIGFIVAIIPGINAKLPDPMHLPNDIVDLSKHVVDLQDASTFLEQFKRAKIICDEVDNTLNSLNYLLKALIHRDDPLEMGDFMFTQSLENFMQTLLYLQCVINDVHASDEFAIALCNVALNAYKAEGRA